MSPSVISTSPSRSSPKRTLRPHAKPPVPTTMATVMAPSSMTPSSFSPPVFRLKPHGKPTHTRIPSGSRPRKLPRTKRSPASCEVGTVLYSTHQIADLTSARFAAMVRERAVLMGYEKPCGKIDRTKGRDWLEIYVPSGPPPDCLVPGVALTRDLEWVSVTRPMEFAHAQRIHRLLKPKVVAVALYFDAKKRVRQAWHPVKVFVGWEEEKVSKTTALSLPSVGANRLSTPTPALSSTGTPSNHSTTSPTNHAQQATASPSLPTEVTRVNLLASYLPDPKALKLDLTDFYKYIKAVKSQRPVTTVPGCVQIKGLVELCGVQNRIIVQTVATLDPKTNTIYQLSLSPYLVVPSHSSPN